MPTYASRRRQVLVVVCTTLAIAATVAGLALTVMRTSHDDASSSPSTRSASTTSAAADSVATSAAADVAADSDPEPIPATTDPEAFARSVAAALFDWDTGGTFSVAQHKGRLLAVADPSGMESPGLAADLANYLPSTEWWQRLAPYATRQWIEIRSAIVPTTWDAAVSQANGGLAPGTTAITITGVRHRTGVVDGQTDHVQYDVAFTVFMVCEPSYPQCYLLRLSGLDTPME